MTTFYLIGLIPAGLIVLAAMWILHASASEARGRNLLLYLLGVGVLCFLAIGIAALLTPQGDNRPLFQVASLLTPSLVGVLALIVIQLGVLRTLRGRALLLAGLLTLIMSALLIPLWSHPFGILFYMLPGALILGFTWVVMRRYGGLGFVLSLIAFVLLSSNFTLNLFTNPFFSALPAWLRTPVGILISLLPGFSVALAAGLILTGLSRNTSDENHVENGSSFRPLTTLQFLLAGLILGVLLYRIYWFSIWDHTSDGLSGLAYSMLSSLTAIGAGMIIALKSAGRARISGAAFAIFVPVLAFGAFHLGWDIDYHTLTEARAARIQAALERFHRRGGRYPSELAELAPRDMLFIPQPVIFEGEGWCYQGWVDDYRLGAVYREYFSTPLSIKIYASEGNIPDGETPDGGWGCPQRLAELQPLYEPAPFFEQEIQVPTEVPLPTSQAP